jgi:hypothetical protein
MGLSYHFVMMAGFDTLQTSQLLNQQMAWLKFIYVDGGRNG